MKSTSKRCESSNSQSQLQLNRLETKVDFLNHQLLTLFRTFDVERCACEQCDSIFDCNYSSAYPSNDDCCDFIAPASLRLSEPSLTTSAHLVNGIAYGSESEELARLGIGGNYPCSVRHDNADLLSEEAKLTSSPSDFSEDNAAAVGIVLPRLECNLPVAKLQRSLSAYKLKPEEGSILNGFTGSAKKRMLSDGFELNGSSQVPKDKKRRKTTVPVKVESASPLTTAVDDCASEERKIKSLPSTDVLDESNFDDSAFHQEMIDSPFDAFNLSGGGDGNGPEMRPCPICDKLLHRGYLPNHIKAKHQNRQPASCNFCGKEFSFVSNLYRHLRKIHNATHIDNASIASPASMPAATPAFLDEECASEAPPKQRGHRQSPASDAAVAAEVNALLSKLMPSKSATAETKHGVKEEVSHEPFSLNPLSTYDSIQQQASRDTNGICLPLPNLSNVAALFQWGSMFHGVNPMKSLHKRASGTNHVN